MINSEDHVRLIIRASVLNPCSIEPNLFQNQVSETLYTKL